MHKLSSSSSTSRISNTNNGGDNGSSTCLPSGKGDSSMLMMTNDQNKSVVNVDVQEEDPENGLE